MYGEIFNPLSDDKILDWFKLKQIADAFLSAFKIKLSAIYCRKHCKKKEKLLVTSNFSFSHNVFHSCISLVRQNVALCGNGLNSRVRRDKVLKRKRN